MTKNGFGTAQSSHSPLRNPFSRIQRSPLEALPPAPIKTCNQMLDKRQNCHNEPDYVCQSSHRPDSPILPLQGIQCGGCPDIGGSRCFGNGQVCIPGPIKSAPESRPKRTVVDCTTDLEQQIGAISRPSHLLALCAG
jgi:hypothetical protein